jgi:hypothetical protein
LEFCYLCGNKLKQEAEEELWWLTHIVVKIAAAAPELPRASEKSLGDALCVPSNQKAHTHTHTRRDAHKTINR